MLKNPMMAVDSEAKLERNIIYFIHKAIIGALLGAQTYNGTLFDPLFIADML